MSYTDGAVEATTNSGAIKDSGIAFHHVFTNDNGTGNWQSGQIPADRSTASSLPDFHLVDGITSLAKMAADSGVLPIGGNSGRTDVLLWATDKPADLPEVWKQPSGTKMDGKCGLTGVSNMLRFYGVEKSPDSIDEVGYRSVGFGMRSGKFAQDLTELTGKKFTAKNIEDGSFPLDVLRKNIKDGKPVAIMYMTGDVSAHWVVVAGIREGKDNPSTEVLVQSGGAYYTIPWKDLQPNWKAGYGGPYPYVVGDEAAPKLPKK
jgi:hypothetical protein